MAFQSSRANSPRWIHRRPGPKAEVSSSPPSAARCCNGHNKAPKAVVRKTSHKSEVTLSHTTDPEINSKDNHIFIKTSSLPCASKRARVHTPMMGNCDACTADQSFAPKLSNESAPREKSEARGWRVDLGNGLEPPRAVAACRAALVTTTGLRSQSASMPLARSWCHNCRVAQTPDLDARSWSRKMLKPSSQAFVECKASAKLRISTAMSSGIRWEATLRGMRPTRRHKHWCQRLAPEATMKLAQSCEQRESSKHNQT